MEIPNKPYTDSRIEIRYIQEINGWGVFATSQINAGVIAEVAPVIVYPRKLAEMAIFVCQAEGVPNKDLMLDQYSLNWREDTAIPLGWTGLYNHKDDNNCQFIANYDDNLLAILTLKDIEKDEQLFVSYGQHWFDEKGYITKYEF